VSINKSVKEFLRGQFHEWFTSEVSSDEIKLVDLHLSQDKAAAWQIQLMDYLKKHPEIAVNGFCQAGLCN